MTKSIRIENACGSTFKAKVLVQDKVFILDEDTKEWLWTGEWKTTNTHQLPCPTALVTDYITSSRRLIVEEVEETTLG